MKRLLYFIILILLFAGLLYSQTEPSITIDPSTGNYIIRYQGYEGETNEVIFEPATKIEPIVESSVFFEPDSGLYKYRYIVKNGLNSRQRLLTFRVDFYTPVDNITKPYQQWRSGLFSYRSTVSWGHTRVRPDGLRTPYSGIAPDSSASGFSFESTGLPAIVNAYFEGAANIVLAFPEEPPGEVDLLLDPLTRFPANTVRRKTLGPRDPPYLFVPIAFLDTLLAYNNQSFELGWLKDAGTWDRYGNYLTAAKNALAQGRIGSCRENLGNILRDVAPDSEVAITSEAYSLLRYNTEYLLEQLPQGEVTINNLIAYIQDASQTGKIDNKGVANSLISKLETAQKHIDKEKTKQAVNAFNAFLNELEAQKEKHVNLEVYEYLKENVEALVEQLSGR